MEIQEDLSRMATLSSWYEYTVYSHRTYYYILCAHLIQYLLFSVLRLTLRKTLIWLADQVSSSLGVFDFVFACAFDLTLGTAVHKATDVFLHLLSVFWLLQIPQRCHNRCEACSPLDLQLCLAVSITAASLCRRAVLTRDTAHYCCITLFSPGWWECGECVLSSYYMQINRAVGVSPTLPLCN